jgi:O-antigen/teichoic acid export membrane protein
LPLSTIFNLFRPVFQGLKDMKDMVLMDIVQKISAFIFLLIFLFCFKTKIWAVLAAYGASLLLSALFSYLKLIAKLPLLINKNIITIISRKEIIFYAAPLFLTVVTTQVFQKVDSLMIGYFCAIKQVGLYTPASNMSFLVSFPLLVFNQIFAPIIAQYYQQGKIKELDYLFKTITRWIFMLGFAAFLFILLMNKEIMQLFGRQYIQASGVLIILACAQLVNAAAGPVSWVLSMTNNQNILATVMISSNLLNIILNVFLIPRFGLLGAAFSTGISVILLNLLNLFFVFKIIKIYPFDIKFIKPFFSGLIAFFLGFVIVNSLTIYDYRMKLFIGWVSFSFTFFILSFLFRYEKEELFMLNILKQKIKG